MTKTQQTERKIIAVLLDEKLVKYPISFDEKEGWVEMEIPVQLSEGVTFKSGDSVNKEQDISQFHWKTVRKEGAVKIIYSDSYPTKANV